MSPRPRGGWQVGTRLFHQQRVIADGGEDPAPDVYTVARTQEGFIVKHYPSATARKACCVVSVARRAEESDVDALARAARHCDGRHIRPGVVAEWSEDDAVAEGR